MDDRVYNYDIKVYEGEALVFKPHFELNVSSYSFKMYIKDNVKGSAVIKEVAGVVAAADIDDNGTTISGYYVTFRVSPEETASLIPSTCQHSVYWTAPGGDPERIFQGEIFKAGS